MSELTKRIIVAIIAAPLGLALIYIGGLPLATLLAVLSAGAAWELFRIARASGTDPLDPIGIPLAAAIPLAVHAFRANVLVIPPSLAATVVVVVLGIAIWARGVNGRPLTSAAATIFGVIYTGGMLSFGYVLRYHSHIISAAAGTSVVGYPLVLTWATDIGAYAVGRLVGGPKLLPSVSPGKTISGGVGGVVAAVLVSWFYVPHVLLPYAQLSLSPTARIVFAIVVSVFAQVGDLAESLLKREAGVKDSSHIIPGHGGLLDRFDSLLFVLPLSALLLGWLL